jgi:hypothetical protein
MSTGNVAGDVACAPPIAVLEPGPANFGCFSIDVKIDVLTKIVLLKDLVFHEDTGDSDTLLERHCGCAGEMEREGEERTEQ